MKFTECFFALLLLAVVVDETSGSSTTTHHNDVIITNNNRKMLLNVTSLDCNMRLLAYNYSKTLMKESSFVSFSSFSSFSSSSTVLLDIFDALQLTELCHVDYKEEQEQEQEDESREETLTLTVQDQRRTRRRRTRKLRRSLSSAEEEQDICSSLDNDNADSDSDGYSATSCIYVIPQQQERQQLTKRPHTLQDGSFQYPYTSIHSAIEEIRRQRRGQRQGSPVTTSRQRDYTVILRGGTHYLDGRSLKLSHDGDSNITIMGYPNEETWISGAVSLASQEWTTVDDTDDGGIYVTNLTSLLRGYDMPPLVSLFTFSARYVRARYPNSNPEVDQWGYHSPLRRRHSLSSADVVEWTKPPQGRPPTFVVVDFATDPPHGIPIKNDSTMPGYNLYATGYGGVCDDVWAGRSYWCSNSSAGGWAEVDSEAAISGRLQIPVGMRYNSSSDNLGTYGGVYDGATGRYVFVMVHVVV
jgi:hypothetical protein